MITPVNELIASVLQYQYNPAAIQGAVLKKLEEATNGDIQIVDPTNPFVFSLESAAVLTSAFMSKNEANTRKQYPVLAQTAEDLYLHMSDTDYLNRFASPSTSVFSILLPLAEVLDKMVIDIATGIKKLVIPRNSFFTIAGINFSIQYPIEIRQLAHGGLQVVYDVSAVSPLQALSTNILKHEIQQNVDGQYINFEFDVQQFNIVSQLGSLNSANDFSLDVVLIDLYYYTRVYVEAADGSWTEIKTTHSDQVYDITVPTAVLKLTGNKLNISIPQIYTGTGVLSSGIRIDVYETKGALDLILWEYPFSAFSATWLAIDAADNTEFVAPLNTIRTIIPYSNSTVTGGSNGISFMDLRTQVINNGIGAPSLPITNAQIETALYLKGYRIVKNIDNITNRTFLATKGMPLPTDKTLITPAASGISTISSSVSELLQISSVKDNGGSITITPDTIYQNINGVVKPLTTDQLSTLLTQPAGVLAASVSQSEYLYTPFHYVVDLTGNELNVRPYYLDMPEIITKLFVNENGTALVQVNTASYNIYRKGAGYAITIVTLSGDVYKGIPDNQVGVQLSFIPNGEVDPAFINGQFVGTAADGERIFTFDLSTNFDVDSTDHIALTKFLMYTEQARITRAGLITEFNILHTTSAPVGQQWVASSIDQALGNFILPTNAIGLTQEKLRVKFGDALPTLWARSRSVISSATYKKYATDSLRTYANDVYETDVNGAVIKFDTVTGLPSLNLLHAGGDLVIDTITNNPSYLHHAGDVMMDANGNGILANSRDMLRQIDVMLIEGTYWFATDDAAINYRNTMARSLVDWLTNDLVSLKAQLLEQTSIFFYPNGTLGFISAMTDGGIISNITASQSFKVDLSVTASVYNDLNLRDQLSTSTISVIRDQLNNATVSLDSITTALRDQYKTDVISMQVSGLGGSANYSVITILDDSKRCSIKKRLTALPNNSLIVEDDVAVNFVLYKV